MPQDGPTVPIIGQQPLVPTFGRDVLIATDFTAEGVAVPVDGDPLHPKRVLLLALRGAHNATHGEARIPVVVPEEMAVALRDALLDLIPLGQEAATDRLLEAEAQAKAYLEGAVATMPGPVKP